LELFWNPDELRFSEQFEFQKNIGVGDSKDIAAAKKLNKTGRVFWNFHRILTGLCRIFGGNLFDIFFA